ncbi:MAG: FliA/WhiG family RNA polymerase sigma factor [Planctomycetota bacterium]|nr:FliA/WhiG family RNA polymerase sigma factor [Planctomycetota bacterium]MDI6786862.1 FliA/WhiG family RNA polymerase sigma factor [Planctomycetota bacterium]
MSNKLSQMEVTVLWEKYKKTLRKNTRNKLIEHYLPIVKTISDKLSLHLPEVVNVNDLFSLGLNGLIDAIKLFNIKRGVRFETYCTRRIKGAMLDGLREADWVPRLVRLKSHRLEKQYRQMEKLLCKKPTDFEVSKSLKIRCDEYNRLRTKSKVTSMRPFAYKNNDEDSNPATANVLEDTRSRDGFKAMLQKDILEYIKGKVPKNERLVLEMYFCDDLTMAEIGSILEVTESRISQIYASSIKRLRRLLEPNRYDWLS